MEDVALVFAGLGIVALILIGIWVMITFVGTIILLCLSIKEKGELKIRGIDENRLKKIVNLSIWSLVITILSCSGCALVVLPILALVFANSNAKTALQAGNIVEAAKKADTALLMIIISNSLIIGISVLNFIGSVIGSIIG